MNGIIFNIQKFSLHDGPGIRTTVFFKGCSLRCKWCANPESQLMPVQYTLDAEKCRGCGNCISVCPNGARSLTGAHPLINGDLCRQCGCCIEACPALAIGREGRSVSVQEVVDTVMKDKVFYDRSGGGVTFSGGEALLQHEFATELARVLKDRGIHLAIETAAAVPSEVFLAFLKEIDFVYIDLKHYDSARHREGTGSGNRQIIENICAVRDSGLPFRVRIPVIPGYNDSLSDAEGFSALLTSLGIDSVQLLPFHQMGERKYSLLNRDYCYKNIKPLKPKDLEAYAQIFEGFGIHTEF